ncbi:P-loop containing nucleoside triphosphate hydrolase protein [Mycena sp. CBHHK59/15]|nr:P-loop containing nucleoside triphosphate hydrolase protein [Mycena sp. CBHHK59/15]
MTPQISSRHHGKTPKPHHTSNITLKQLNDIQEELKVLPRRPQLTSKITPEQLNDIQEELKLLPGLIKTHYVKWANGAQDFQLECMGAQKLGKDVLLHAATGSRKTGIAAGPHLLPSSKGKVTLVVSPLLSLHEEQVVTFRDEFGLKATAINSVNGGCTKAVMQSVIAGEWQIVILSPEMLLSRRFIDGVLRKSEFGARCLSVFIDEAHCVSHWGDSFRKKYASIGIIRAFLPRATSIVAVTATLTPRVHQDLLTKLQFNPRDYLFCTIGNDRPNVSQVIRALEHPANSYRDLNFVVPSSMTRPTDIKKIFLYTDDIQDGGKIIDYLNGRVDSAHRSHGLIRPYNSGMSPKYRAEVMSLFKAGIIRVLVCTDAAGMGCDIPDIELVVQWKIPKNLSSWKSRCLKSERVKSRQLTVVAWVGVGEGADREVDEEVGVVVGQLGKRGSYRGLDDAKPQPAPDEAAEIPVDAPGEGLYVFIQAAICRRLVLANIFKNSKPNVPPLHCCDICNPKLFDATRPGKPIRSTRQKGIRRGPPVDSVRESLFLWRRDIKKMHYPRSLFAPHALLDDATCELLASVGPIESMEMLGQLLGSSWSLWDEFGSRLYAYLHALDIPAVPRPPPRKKAATATEPLNPPSVPSRLLPPPLPPQINEHIRYTAHLKVPWLPHCNDSIVSPQRPRLLLW